MAVEIFRVEGGSNADDVVIVAPGGENDAIINGDETETQITTTATTPEPSFIDKYGIYILIGVVVLAMVLMYVFRKKIA